ncbi:hypothetical protein [Haloferula sp.]|uniref:hypothetical protein n=1 Tax=Haloferula sp. TaxID=2497595 RepID=UPI0032A0B405
MHNNSNSYDAVNARVIIPPGVTHDTYIDNVLRTNGGNWNYYGTHDTGFVSSRTSITGGVLDDNRFTSDDPLVNQSIRLDGKLVDLDSAAIWNSQIFFNRFSIGDSSSIRLRAKNGQRLHSRWIGRRATYKLPIAGAFGVVWQTTFSKEDVDLDGADQSPLIAALQNALQQAGVAGIMLRFATYRTLYFQGDGAQDVDHAPDSIDARISDLHQRYRNGENISNPAYSYTVGSVGLWHEGEISTVPQGRYLTAGVPATVSNGKGFALGPCVAEADEARRRLTIDFCQVVPEVNFARNKADFGTLKVVVDDGAGEVVVGRLETTDYNQAAYERRAGIVELDLSQHPDSNIFRRIADGELRILASSTGQDVTVLREQGLTVQASVRDVYLDQGERKSIALTVLDRGQPAPVGTRILVGRCDRDGNLIPSMGIPPDILDVQTPGKVAFEVVADAPGFLNFQFLPFRANDPVPTQSPRIDIRNGFFLSVRFLPFDDELEQQTPDNRLSFKFIYDNVLRVYHLSNPVMARPGIDLPLNDSGRITEPSVARRIRHGIAATEFESPRYMPVTRDLSRGKRRLLQRFCELVENGNLPDDSSGNQEEGPEVEEEFDVRFMKKEG